VDSWCCGGGVAGGKGPDGVVAGGNPWLLTLPSIILGYVSSVTGMCDCKRMELKNNRKNKRLLADSALKPSYFAGAF